MLAAERAIALAPGYAKAHNNLGLALANQGKLDEAIREYRLVLEKKPDHVSALNNLGNALSRKGQSQLDSLFGIFGNARIKQTEHRLRRLHL